MHNFVLYYILLLHAVLYVLVYVATLKFLPSCKLTYAAGNRIYKNNRNFLITHECEFFGKICQCLCRWLLFLALNSTSIILRWFFVNKSFKCIIFCCRSKNLRWQFFYSNFNFWKKTIDLKPKRGDFTTVFSHLFFPKPMFKLSLILIKTLQKQTYLI